MAPHRRQRGFTLIELSIVVLIVGLLLALVLPRLPDITSTRLEASADKLSTTLSYLADEAALTGRIYRLSIDLGRNRWETRVMAPYARGELAAGFVEDWDAYIRPEILPPEVHIEAVEAGEARVTAGIAELTFTPDGTSLPVRIVLAGPSRRVSVRFDPVSGVSSLEAAEESSS